MLLGVTIFPTDTTIPPTEIAREVERRGFESLWFPEHSHIPASRRTPWGGAPGRGPLPEKYARLHDPFVALAAAAAVTERIRLCTGVTLVPQRDPIWLAKQVASLDVLSGGRVTLGIGYGWNREEMEQHGVDPGRRRELLREKLLLMKALWTEEEASFEGRLIRLEPSWSWPKPLQRPHPPVLLGAQAGPVSVSHMVELCDGWMPLGRRPPEEGVDEVRSALSAAGRDPATFQLTWFGARADRRFLERVASLGFHRAVLPLESGPREEVLEQLDHLVPLSRELRTGS